MIIASKPAHPAGHFYSPIVDPAEIAARDTEIWPANPEVLGIEFDDASHLKILESWFPRFMPEWDYPEVLEESDTLDRFFVRNSQFSWLDCRTLYVMLRALRPRRMIEVGSGFSSLLTADVNRRFFEVRMEFTCIEPYPRPFLRAGHAGITRLVERKVQEVPLDEFARLEAGDILFIDSSHVAKTGSDVNYLYFEVLPRLASGVYIHIHDIFLPHDYLRDWVIAENRSWNEQYVLRALLMYSTAFRVIFGCSYVFHRFPERVAAALAHPSGHAFAGGSFWMQRA